MWLTRLVAPRHVGSSQTRARTHVPCIGRQILNHCATREAQDPLLKGKIKRSLGLQNAKIFPFLCTLEKSLLRNHLKRKFIASCRCDNCQIAIQIFFFHGALLIADRITHESFKIEMWKITSPQKRAQVICYYCPMILCFLVVCLLACFFTFRSE